jgi:transposase InsO family protein
MPKCGIKKLYLDIEEDLKLNGIKMGRDAFYDFARAHKLLVPKTKLYHVTTNSNHGFHKPKDLLFDLEHTRSEHVVGSDITYMKLATGRAYLALTIDLYSKRVLGYKIDTNMRVQLVIDSMEMAIKNRLNSDRALITHSERGIQYCCPAYTDIAKKHGLLLSTTQNSSPYENAVAERLNGILKYDPSLKVRTGAAVWIEPSESKFKNCRKNDKTSH